MAALQIHRHYHLLPYQRGSPTEIGIGYSRTSPLSLTSVSARIPDKRLRSESVLQNNTVLWAQVNGTWDSNYQRDMDSDYQK